MNNIQKILIAITENLKLSYQSHQSISGGDISDAYLLQTKQQALFVKINDAPTAQKMFELEHEGLETIGKTKTIKVPKVLLIGNVGNVAFFAMEFITSKRSEEQDFHQLGVQLAALHQCTTTTTFGFQEDNFIGKLPQSNQQHKNWSNFYVEERLLPQF